MRLKELRQENELTQFDVAKGIDTSQRNISRWENEDNEPSSSFVIKLAQYFNVSTDYLLGLEDDLGAKIAAPLAPMSDDLYSSEERKLVEVYRSLSDEMRGTLWSVLSTWAPNASIAHNKKNVT